MDKFNSSLCFLTGFPLTECILNWGLMDCFKPPQIVNYPIVTPAGEELGIKCVYFLQTLAQASFSV